MSSSALATIVARYSKLCRPFPQESDAELILRFAQRNDAAAFEQLVGRYASLVWGVCRRVLPCEADCEDAFQATFLSLVRQAGSLDPDRPLAGWLHTVALRVARKAWGRAQRQLAQRAECLDRRSSSPVQSDVCAGELMSSIDEELDRLPAPLRIPIILCCLEGRTRDEAAEAMGCTVAAVKSRLERGRTLLRRRLERRGIQLPAALLVLTLTGRQVSAALKSLAVQSALGSPPATVAALATASSMSWSAKALVVSLSVIATGLLGIGALGAIQSSPQKEPIPDQKSAADSKSQPPAKKETAQPLRDRFGDPLPEGAVRRFGTLRFRHNEIAELAFTPDGKRLIAGTGRNPLAIFDAKTGEKLRQVGKVSPNNYYGFALSRDGERVACCGFDVSIWDTKTGNLIKELGCGRCQAVSFSPDGTKIAVVKEHSGEFQVVDATTGKSLVEWKVGENGKEMYMVNSLSFSFDGKLVAALAAELHLDGPGSIRASNFELHLWDANTGVPAGNIGTPEENPCSYAFHPDTNRVVTVAKDQAIRFWDLETRKLENHIALSNKNEMAMSLQFSSDGKRCAFYAGKGILVVMDVEKSKEIRRINAGQPDSQSPWAIALSPDGRTLAFARLYGDCCIRLWDIESGAERLADAGHTTAATLELSPDGRALISRGDKVFRWDLQTGEGRVQPAEAKEGSRTGKWDKGGWNYQGPRWQFVSGGSNEELEILSLDGKKSLRKIKEPSIMRGHAISPDGVHLAMSYQDGPSTVFLWNPEKDEQPHKLIGHPDACQALLFTHDGKRLIAGAGTHNKYTSETLFVYDVPTAKLIHKFASNSAPGPMILTADDRLLITGGLWNDAEVRVWDMQTGNLLATLIDPAINVTSEDLGQPINLMLGISNVVLSQDERLLAIVTNRADTSTVSVWETSSWKLVRAFAPNQPRHSNSVVISRDG
ncbi:MAG TPA: sigma-70 family RNA polymerase sigma factor, partial [Gemmataceae bacterium]|nr:sigma-70 family RNA polymerase sigma factor [Gemmataceae bacterium]